MSEKNNTNKQEPQINTEIEKQNINRRVSFLEKTKKILQYICIFSFVGAFFSFCAAVENKLSVFFNIIAFIILFTFIFSCILMITLKIIDFSKNKRL